jgi:hypothetical protein
VVVVSSVVVERVVVVVVDGLVVDNVREIEEVLFAIHVERMIGRCQGLRRLPN